MSELWSCAQSAGAGFALGGVFYGGLWWTVRQGVASRQPGRWFIGSLLVRTGVVLAGLYFVADGRWQAMLSCLFGFVMARLVVTWLAGRPETMRPHGEREAGNAP